MSKISKPRNHFNLLYEALRRLYIGEFSYAFGNFAIVIDAKRHQHSFTAAERVDENRNRLAAHVLEEQSGPALFRNAVGDLGDLEVGAHFGGDAFQLMSFFEER